MLTVPKSDYGLGQLLLDHVDEQAPQKFSISLYIIAESFNLYKDGKTSVSDILGHVPFAELKEKGIDEVTIDFVSCNTYEIASELIKSAEKIAKDNKIKVKSSFHNGYIFNNITYCYASAAQYEGFSKTNKAPEKLYDSGDESMPKNNRLVQVIHPGFSIVCAEDSVALQKYVVDKMVPSRNGNNVKKQLFHPQRLIDIQQMSGASWQYISDCRSLTQSNDAETPPQDVPERSPSPEMRANGFRSALQGAPTVGGGR